MAIDADTVTVAVFFSQTLQIMFISKTQACIVIFGDEQFSWKGRCSLQR